ncbi:MAG: hypothetical protein D6797_08665, partial [Bdellovibrio sp.]
MKLSDIFTETSFQVALLVGGLLLYLLVPNSIKPYVGLVMGLYIIASFFGETLSSAKERGWKEEAK